MTKPESESYVTIPYFLYEAMARFYYTRVSGDYPISRPLASPDPTPQFTGEFMLNDEDVPPTWKPQGVAAELRKKNTSAPNPTITAQKG